MKGLSSLLVVGCSLALSACADGTMESAQWGNLSSNDAFSEAWPDVTIEDDALDDIFIEEDVVQREDGAEILEPPPVEEPAAPVELNLNFIGGPCEDGLACDFEQSQCQVEALGFPDGHCSKPCELFCPDRAGSATTFCAESSALGLEAGNGWCVARCDFGMSPTGCRAGYQCVEAPRFGEPETQVHVCVPGDGPPQISACHQQLVERGIGFEMATNPMDTVEGQPDLVCDVVEPIRVDGLMHGVAYRAVSGDAPIKRIFASCPLALAMEETARLVADHGVTDIIHLGVYNCRVISGTNKLSEHAHANAIDISGLYLGPEAYYSVYEDWEDGVSMPVTDSGAFLKWFVEQLHLDWVFNIILTPEYNAAHDDHFHCDLTDGSYSLH